MGSISNGIVYPIVGYLCHECLLGNRMSSFFLFLIILFLNIYFYLQLILKMVYNAICGQTIDDIREIDENDSVGDTNHKVETPKMNGHSKKD